MTAGQRPLGTLDRLRRRGVQAWAAFGWAALLLLLAADLWMRTGGSIALLAIGVVVNVAPTVMALRGRYDATARTLVGSLAAVLPAMLVFQLRGHAWQMDAHMYFFVTMAALVVLSDWRPIALAAALVAVHHVVFEALAPAWVFAGSGNIGRVLFHAAAVILQCAVLSLLTVRFGRLLDAQDAALLHSSDLADAADEERRRTVAALDQARMAEAEAARERRAREELAACTAAERRRELVTLAQTFERSVTSVVTSIGEAADRLEETSVRLDRTTAGVGETAGKVANGATSTAGEISGVAASIRDLSQSIRVIAQSAGQQAELTGVANDEAKRSVRTIAMLEEQAVHVEGLVEVIRTIAGKTNLLALNATIEAARAGEAGRGFTVVAGEVKSLAADTARASDEIRTLLLAMRGRVDETGSALRCVHDAIGQVTIAADGIAAAVGEQRATARGVDAGTDRAVASSTAIERQIGGLALATGEAASLSFEVRSSASYLAASARTLRTSTDTFVAVLREEQVLAA